MGFLDKIISGGQTGADLGALVCGKRLNITTGGWAPKGWKTEKGPQPVLATYGLVEHASADYPPRTEQNIIDADATLILSTNPHSPGTIQTINFARRHGKPVSDVINPFDKDAGPRIADFLNKNKPSILNVAGNRESKSPGITRMVADILIHAIDIARFIDVFSLNLETAIVKEEHIEEATILPFVRPERFGSTPQDTSEQYGLNFEPAYA